MRAEKGYTRARFDAERRDGAIEGDEDWSALMGRAQQGDREAYGRLLTEIAPYLRAMARRGGVPPAEVEDAVQDILLTVHAIRHTFDRRRPFGPWIVTIARRRLADHHRRQRRRRAVEAELEIQQETFADGGTNSIQSIGSYQLRQAIERLPAVQQQAIVLLKLQELSLKDAAQSSGASIVSLKVAVHRGIKTLRRILGVRGPE
jgi:RNA polymerase sigma factor (sigma-70 family)